MNLNIRGVDTLVCICQLPDKYFTVSKKTIHESSGTCIIPKIEKSEITEEQFLTFTEGNSFVKLFLSNLILS